MLSTLQERIARIVASLPESDGFALAGGAALVVAGVVDRSTRDLDFFGPSGDDVQRLAAAVEQALTDAGVQIRRERATHTFVRFSIADGDDSTELDLAADARIRPAELGPLGPMLSVEELAADKLLALFDRAQARDFLDVAALIDRFSADELGIQEAARRELSRSIQQWRHDLAGMSPRPKPRRELGPDLSL